MRVALVTTRTLPKKNIFLTGENRSWLTSAKDFRNEIATMAEKLTREIPGRLVAMKPLANEISRVSSQTRAAAEAQFSPIVGEHGSGLRRFNQAISKDIHQLGQEACPGVELLWQRAPLGVAKRDRCACRLGRTP
jgi:hypothetical protein